MITPWFARWPATLTVAVALHLVLAHMPIRGPMPRSSGPVLVELELFELPPTEAIERAEPLDTPPEGPPPVIPQPTPTPRRATPPSPAGARDAEPRLDKQRASVTSNREELSTPETPIVTGLPLEPTDVDAPSGMEVRPGNTFAHGFEAPEDASIQRLGSFEGGGRGGGGTLGGVLGGGVQTTAPTARTLHEPAYPPSLRDRGVEGVVELRVQILPNGRAGQIDILRSPHPDFERVVRDAVLRSRWHPGTQNGAPVPAWTHIRFNFSMDERRRHRPPHTP